MSADLVRKNKVEKVGRGRTMRLLLKILWRPYCSGALSGGALETAAFTIFLHARMLGCAAEIDDHLNRGRNMDTRTPASQCRFVA